MRRRGYTLLEMIIVMAMVAVVMVAVMRAYSAGLSYDQRMRQSDDKETTRIAFEDTLTQLIRHAYINPDTTTNYTYLIGSSGAPASAGNTTGTSSTPTATNSQGLADTLTLTVVGTRLNSNLFQGSPNSNNTFALPTDPDDAFQQSNQNYGPQGGVAEEEISLTPVGDAGGQQGLFIREQRPSDLDPSQGGYEHLLEPDVTQIQFEFFDGANWDQSWDTRTTNRLPAAIRVTYRLNGEDQDRVLIIRVPASDATPDNPVTVGATS